MAYSVIKCEVGGSTSQGYYYEYLCESVDDVANLPTGADSADITRPAPGSLALIEGDLSIYLLQNNREWSEVMSGTGGGGGGNSGGVLFVKLTFDDATQTAEMDKTAGDIISALKAGKVVMAVDDYMSDPPQADDTLWAQFVIGANATDSGFENVTFGDAPVSYYAATLDDYPKTSGD